MPLKGKQNTFQCLSNKSLLVCTHHSSCKLTLCYNFQGIRYVVYWVWIFQCLLSRARNNNEQEVERCCCGLRSLSYLTGKQLFLLFLWPLCLLFCLFDLLAQGLPFHNSCLFLYFYPTPSLTPRVTNANELCISKETSYQLINFMLQLFFSNLDWKPLNQGSAVLHCLSSIT